MMAFVRDNADLRENLREQTQMLISSAQAYDKGVLWEAKRMATHVDTLLHDRGKRTVSLLTQLNVLMTLSFVSSSRGLSELKPDTPLLLIVMTEKGTSFAPLCQSMAAPPWLNRIKFSKWWEESIYRDNKGRTYSRKNLVCSLRDQDGGSHLDGKISDEEYVSMKAANFPQMSIGAVDGTKSPVPNAHVASMRQIAWEVLESLKSVIPA